MALWTTWCDYFATGEGRTQMACIGYAHSEAEALDAFEAQFGDWYRIGAEAQVGVIHNSVTDFLFSHDALTMLTNNEGKANILVHASIHFNFS